MFILLWLLLLCSPRILAHQESLEQLDRLLLSKSVPNADKEKYVKAILPLVRNIEYKDIIDVNFTLPLLREGPSVPYRPFNPSILKTEEGYDVICRLSNYSIPSYKTIIPDGPYLNKNIFLKYDKNFNLLFEQEMLFPSHLEHKVNKNWQVEDVRICRWNNDWWLISTAVPPQYYWYVPKVAICKIDYPGQDVPIIQSLTLFNGPEAKRAEKNWLHIFEGDKLRLIYSYDPFILMEPNIETGTCKTVLHYSPKLDFSRFRGSAAPINFEDGYLLMVHERLQHFNYTHRFLYLDKQFNITKISQPFTLANEGIDYCTSMTIDHSGKNLILPIGVYDREAKILVVDLEYVKGLLYDIVVR